MAYTSDQVARMVDHTLLKPEATDADLRALVEDAKRIGTYSICVSPNKLPLPADIDLGDVKVAVVTGFPSGAHQSAIKAAEASRAVAQGADEVDMVINVSDAVQNNFAAVEEDIRTVREAMPYGVLKVIIVRGAHRRTDRGRVRGRQGRAGRLRQDLDGLPSLRRRLSARR